MHLHLIDYSIMLIHVGFVIGIGLAVKADKLEGNKKAANTTAVNHFE